MLSELETIFDFGNATGLFLTLFESIRKHSLLAKAEKYRFF